MTVLNKSYFKLREKIRFHPALSHTLYLCQSLVHSNWGSFRRQVQSASKHRGRPEGVALCCRIRDEARYLVEWIDYYLAAGIDHFFFYEKLSRDDFRSVLRPYIDAGVVSLFEDWYTVPVSPAAEQDCILRTIGRFEWVGFIDADEFVVVRDGRSIGEFLSQYRSEVAIALHWYMFGSGGHVERPYGPVIRNYTLRAPKPNRHVKCFVRPERVANYRNSHSWYYRQMRSSVSETGRRVGGSFASPPSAQKAWINHYHHKSDQDYFEKAARKSVLDTVGMKFELRSRERHLDSQLKHNEVFDDSAIQYHVLRSRARLLESPLVSQAALNHSTGRAQSA